MNYTNSPIPNATAPLQAQLQNIIDGLAICERRTKRIAEVLIDGRRPEPGSGENVKPAEVPALQMVAQLTERAAILAEQLARIESTIAG